MDYKEILGFHCPRFNELPTVPLYKDQVIIYLENVAKELNATAIVRGLRAVTDFEYEFQLAAGNEFLDNEIEMVFLMASLNKSFISSSSIKEFFSFNVDISNLVPEVVVKYFNQKNK